MSIIIYGPQACGKTTNVKKLAKYFNVDLSDVVDPWGPTMPLPQNALALTNVKVPGSLDFFEVMKAINPVQRICHKTKEQCKGPLVRDLYSSDSFVNCDCLATTRSYMSNTTSVSALPSPKMDSHISFEASNVS